MYVNYKRHAIFNKDGLIISAEVHCQSLIEMLLSKAQLKSYLRKSQQKHAVLPNKEDLIVRQEVH